MVSTQLSGFRLDHFLFINPQHQHLILSNLCASQFNAVFSLKTSDLFICCKGKFFAVVGTCGHSQPMLPILHMLFDCPKG
jgi:hypothetical protein